MSISRKAIHLKVNPSVASEGLSPPPAGGACTPRQFRHVVKRLAQKRTRKRLTWFGMAIAILFMLAWNWKLVLSTGSGISLMWLVYAGLGWNWRKQWTRWQPFFKGSQGQLTVAVGSGGIAALSTYLMASIWADAENRWLATGAILQGVVTLSTLGLVLWQMFTTHKKDEKTRFESWLFELTAQDVLKRLIAVRQLTELVNQDDLPLSYQQQLNEYFRLMLTKEQDETVRDALLKSLGQWNAQTTYDEAPPQPLQIPVTMKRSYNTVYRQI